MPPRKLPPRRSLRRGVPLVIDRDQVRPIATAAVNADLSMYEIAHRFGVSYSAVKHWDSRRRAPGDVKALLNKAPYHVPLRMWS
jgi:DNA-binding transcriptional regulator YiaG